MDFIRCVFSAEQWGPQRTDLSFGCFGGEIQYLERGEWSCSHMHSSDNRTGSSFPVRGSFIELKTKWIIQSSLYIVGIWITPSIHVWHCLVDKCWHLPGTVCICILYSVNYGNWVTCKSLKVHYDEYSWKYFCLKRQKTNEAVWCGILWNLFCLFWGHDLLDVFYLGLK